MQNYLSLENNSIIFKLKILFMTSYINKRIISKPKIPGNSRGPVDRPNGPSPWSTVDQIQSGPSKLNPTAEI